MLAQRGEASQFPFYLRLHVAKFMLPGSDAAPSSGDMDSAIPGTSPELSGKGRPYAVPSRFRLS